MSENKVNHPNHYAGSSAESWDLTVLEWGPEYAIAAWVIQAQQYYDRHLQKNGLEDLEKALEFINSIINLAMMPLLIWTHTTSGSVLTS